jgi:RNA polymerase sigma-70 factor (ECF subfamily)
MAWVSTIARNQAITYVRGNRSRDQFGAEVARDANLPTIDGNLVVLANERAKYIERRLQSLTGTHRRAIRSAFFGGMTYPEIAARNNVPLGTVKSWVRRGLIALRDDFHADCRRL